MASVEWRPGMATTCSKCGGRALRYDADGSGHCTECGAVTASMWANAAMPATPVQASESRAPPAIRVVSVQSTPGPAPPPVYPAPPARVRGLFLPGKLTAGQRVGYLVGGAVCALLTALIVAVDVMARTTGFLDGALIGGLGVVAIALLGAAVVGRPIRWR